MFLTTRSNRVCAELPRSITTRSRLRLPELLRLVELAPAEERGGDEHKKLKADKHGLEDLGGRCRVRRWHGAIVSPAPVACECLKALALASALRDLSY